MPNTREKEKLIELIELVYYCSIEELADHLIRNGIGFVGRDIHWATEQAYKNGYAKAVKEFAERLKEKHRHNTTSIVSLVTVFDNINNLVKEMVGAEPPKGE